MNRRTFLLTSFSTAVLGYFGFTKEALADKQKYYCDLRQAANFDASSQVKVGHLTNLKIGETVIPNTWELINPEKPEEKKQNVGVFTAIRWDGRPVDPITFTCQVPAAAFKVLAALQHKGVINRTVEFAFTIYENTGTNNPVYYKAFYSGDKVLKGLIEKESGVLEFEIDDELNETVPSPRNWELYLSIMPSDIGEQLLYIGFPEAPQLAKKWGSQS